MIKNKKMLLIFFTLVLSMVLTVSLVACKTECKHKFGEWVNRNGDETYCENRLYFRECENCGEEEWKEGAESDHDFEVETGESNCEYGELKICKNCGKTETGNNTPSGTHNFVDWQTISSDETYCESRRYYRICEDCGETEWKNGTQEDHIFETETVEPTCTTVGYDQKVCSLCSKIEVISGTETPIAPHDINSEYLFNRNFHWQACDNCDYETPHSAHIYNNSDVCSVCQNQAVMEGLTFADMGDYYEVSGYVGTEKNVIIPSSYNGKPVTSIGDSAFYQNFDIELVVIGSNVNVIGYKAFSNCYWLTTVYIPDSVTVIGEDAFWNCMRLTSVFIPNSVIEIGAGAFAACTNLTRITVDEDCLTYKSVDGSLYSKDGKILIQYASGKTDEVFEVPDGVETIGDYAFMNGINLTSIIIGDDVKSIGDLAFVLCLNLTSVIIGDDVKSIGEGAFFYCPKLSSVLIPRGVESIGDRAFSYCDNILSVYCYEESDFTIGVENEPLTSAINYYYSESAPTEAGNYWHYVDGEIEVWQENASQGLEFELNEDGVSYSVIGMGECEDTEIVIPNFYEGLPVTNIGEYAFSKKEDITSVVIPDSVKRIQAVAFASCPSLESVTVGRGVKEIRPGAFADCPSLTEITVDANNAAYKHIDGNLYTKDGKTLVQYAAGKTDSTFAIPSHVEEIAMGAFAYSQNFTSIVIPDSVKKIGISAFYNCDNLESVVISQSIEYIGFSAFDECDKLAYVYYLGSESEWDNIAIGGEDDELFAIEVLYYYSENPPTKSGNYWHYNNGEIEIWD